jgi:DNA repair exonuclease SbcCD nuclease subunit
MSKVFIFTDTHLGARSNSTEWMDIMEEAHFDFIIPTIKKHFKPGDIIVNCGDVFDNRTSVNVKSLDLGIKIYEELGKIGPVHIIAGNHDIYYKTNTDVTSLDSLKYIPNVTIHKDCSILEHDSHKFLMMPWRKDIKEEAETLQAWQKEHNCEYAFMHGTFSLIKYNKYVKIDKEDGANPKSADGYKRVYTGHIHWSQQKRNINVVGTPYQITRGDSGNLKGMFVLDLETGKDKFYENTISPKFIQFKIDEIDKEQLMEIHKLSKNNFVDINIKEKLLSTSSSKLTKVFHKIGEQARVLNIFPIEADYGEIDESASSLDAKELINKEIDNRFEGEDNKKARKIFEDLFKTI